MLTPIAPATGRGVSNATLLNQAEARVARVDVEPNGVRNLHAHDDARFHLFIPVTGTVQLEIESEMPLELAPGC